MTWKPYIRSDQLNKFHTWLLQNFWTRLSSKYGTKYYWQERGEGNAIVNAVSAIDTCAREPMGRLQCSKIQGELGEEPSAGPIEKMFLGG